MSNVSEALNTFTKQTSEFFSAIISNLNWIITIFLIAYTIIPFLSPVFFYLGADRFGYWIQTIYKYLCHQRPERSIFLFGEKLFYSTAELKDHGYIHGVHGYPFIGNTEIGYKVAFCVRDTFIYASMAISSLLITIRKPKFKMRWWMVGLTTLPIAIDGLTQFAAELIFLSQETLGIHLEKPFYLSNNLFRAVTGTIFGLGISFLIFPELRDVAEDESEYINNDKKK